jgi:hypothetical protein
LGQTRKFRPARTTFGLSLRADVATVSALFVQLRARSAQRTLPFRRHVCTSKAGPDSAEGFYSASSSESSALIGWLLLRAHMELITVVVRELAIANARSQRSTS